MVAVAFANIEEEFNRRVRRTVWCSVASVDGKGRPRSRILHPIWDGATGWVATARHSFKARHLAHNPYVSLTYWDPEQQQVYADCKAEWEDSADEKRRIWKLYKSTAPPLGYDLAMFFKSPDDSEFGLLKLTPWRVELWSLADLVSGKPPVVWRG